MVRALHLPMTVLSRILALAVLSSCAGCHWLAGNPDAELNGASVWHDAAPVSPTVDSEDRTVWIRVRSKNAEPNTLRVLAGQLRQGLREEGWRIEDSGDLARVWVDLDVRYWGPNPARDEGDSTYAKVLRGRRPDVLAEGETARGGRFSMRSLLTPAEAVISHLVANVFEYDLVVDVQLQIRRPEAEIHDRQTLVVWVRKIDLGEREAAVAIHERALVALREVFRVQ